MLLGIVLFVVLDLDCWVVFVLFCYNILKFLGSFFFFYNIVLNGGYFMYYWGLVDLIVGNNLLFFYRN